MYFLPVIRIEQFVISYEKFPVFAVLIRQIRLNPDRFKVGKHFVMDV